MLTTTTKKKNTIKILHLNIVILAILETEKKNILNYYQQVT